VKNKNVEIHDTREGPMTSHFVGGASAALGDVALGT
jgi:hypothetical protein